MNVLKLRSLIENVEQSVPTNQREWTNEEKKAALEAIGRYNEYGGQLRRSHSLMEIAHTLSKITEAAELFASKEMTESSDQGWFDNHTVARRQHVDAHHQRGLDGKVPRRDIAHHTFGQQQDLPMRGTMFRPQIDPLLRQPFRQMCEKVVAPSEHWAGFHQISEPGVVCAEILGKGGPELAAAVNHHTAQLIHPLESGGQVGRWIGIECGGLSAERQA
jgi:hypothetical protein